MSNNNKKKDADKTFDPTRRRFVKNTGIALGGVAGGSLLTGLLTNQVKTDDISDSKDDKIKSSPMEARTFFTRFEDFVVLEQATECIFPEDDHGPGAIGLGVPYFIDKQLAGTWGMNATDYRQGPFDGADAESVDSRLTRGDLFIIGIRTMSKLSQDRFNTTFDKAEEEQQIEILEDFEADKVDMKLVSSASFFELLRMSVLEGAYSDPMYGGNRNMAGWKMKEYPGPVPSYANVIEEDKFVKMEPISLTDYQQKS